MLNEFKNIRSIEKSEISDEVGRTLVEAILSTPEEQRFIVAREAHLALLERAKQSKGQTQTELVLLAGIVFDEVLATYSQRH